jgi:DNA-binding MarR family transcriptional regulator
MENGNYNASLKLLEAFVKIKRFHWNGAHIDNIKHSEIFVLFCIKKSKESETEGIKLSEISKRMHVSNPTTTKVINGLEENGYVVRCIDKDDRRSARITLTPKGEEAIIKANDAFHAFFDELADFLGEKKSLELAALLEEVYAFFDNKRDIS